MAETISPVSSQAIEKKISPLFHLPPTDFTPHEDHQIPFDPQRLESGSTLYNEDESCAHEDREDDSSTHEDLHEFSDQRGSNTTPTRPSLAASKFVTETARPVAMRPLESLTQTRSTGARPSDKPLRPLVNSESSSEASDSWSSDEIDGSHKRKRGQIDHNPLSSGRLNQVRRRPSRTKSKIDDRKFSIGNEHFHSRGRVADDGRLNISVNETANSGYLAKALGATITRHLRPHAEREEKVKKTLEDDLHSTKPARIPRMNIVIMVIGSRGDIQPFLKIGKILQDKYNHRVRIATHPTFKKFVEEDIGLEFFSVGGDPSELMAFMVKNPGLIPSLETVKAGEIGRRRESMFEMFQGFWRACINATDDEKDVANLKMMGGKFPFVADAIIANPPSFAHFHCAEKLGIPLHLVFTFPYTPTQSFPHPLANIKATNVDQNYTNFMSYPLVDLMTWQGLGDLVNRFRVKTLGLEPMSTLWAPGQLSRLRVPTTYLWSPGLVPKPADWGPEIDIAGYVFLDLASSYKAPEELTRFLDRDDGREIVYIGFGSISGINDPVAFTEMIFGAVERAGVRALVSRGWGGMGDGMDVPDTIHLLDNVPHDWLFPRVDAVIHHGGAGTTAAGLKCGKPTMIVPFFGDQPFWSAMIVKAGAGAKKSLPLKKLDVEKFAEGIKQCLRPEAQAKAQAIAKSIEEEGDGAENAVDSFHRSLPLDGEHTMRCGIFEDRIAVWQVKNTKLHLSALAADLLIDNKQLNWGDLRLLRHYEWHDFQGPGEPLTGAGGAAIASLQEFIHGLASIPESTKRDVRKHKRAKRKRKGMTVADAVTKPAKIAYVVRGDGSTIEAAKAKAKTANSEYNFQGEAEPPKFPSLAPVVSDQPMISRVTTTSSNLSNPAPVAILKDVGHGVGQSSKALLYMPLEVWYALALGFRNAPRLYGDALVRPPPNTITGLRSGFIAAGDELWLGFYDGVTGLVRLPYHDVKAGGLAGLPKGVARGVGGLVLKPLAGVFGVGAYSGKGLQASMRKRFRDTTKTERWIRRARMNQGAKDVLAYETRAKRSSDRPGGLRRINELEEMRTKAFARWSTCHEQVMAESREKERKLSVLPSRGKKDADSNTSTAKKPV